MSVTKGSCTSSEQDDIALYPALCARETLHEPSRFRDNVCAHVIVESATSFCSFFHSFFRSFLLFVRELWLVMPRHNIPFGGLFHSSLAGFQHLSHLIWPLWESNPRRKKDEHSNMVRNTNKQQTEANQKEDGASEAPSRWICNLHLLIASLSDLRFVVVASHASLLSSLACCSRAHSCFSF